MASKIIKKIFILFLLLSGLLLAGFTGISFAWKPGDTVFDRTGNNISFLFNTFMKANEDNASQVFWSCVPGARQFIFDNSTAFFLRKYYFIFIPGGEFDAASGLVKYCEDGTLPLNLQYFFEKNPTTKNDIENFLQEYICAKPDMVNTLYNTYLGTFKTYETYFAANNLAFTRLDYFASEGPSHIGDRIGKLDLIAQTIDTIEAGAGGDNATVPAGYILIGHSFGGLNICDFLVELLDGHAPGTPEWKFFARTKVRSWPAQKKERIYKKIRAAVLLNTFIQGNHSNEQRLIRMADNEDSTSTDPVQEAILAVLEKSNNAAVTTEEFIADEKVHLALITARYRCRYYLTDNNLPSPGTAHCVQDAFDRIAASIPVVSVGCMVPKYSPYTRAGINLLIYKSRFKWKEENLPNDGAVDTYGGIFPELSADHIILNAMDHGTLVMKPDFLWITTGSTYNQIPFIKTLLKHVESRLKVAGG